MVGGIRGTSFPQGLAVSRCHQPVLILRDVLGFRAKEVADILDTTHESVVSALKRARTSLELLSALEPAPKPNSDVERMVVERLMSAWESHDVDGVISLLTADVLLSMLPTPLEYRGRQHAAQFLSIVAFHPGRNFRLVPTRANGQPAFGFYVRDPSGPVSRATGLLVLTLAGEHVKRITRFDNSVLPWLGLPRVLPD